MDFFNISDKSEEQYYKQHGKDFDSFLDHCQSTLEFDKPVGVNFESDQENASKLLGRTAFYDPNELRITIYTSNRHPKDVLRSLAHELVHHMQNCEGSFDNVSFESETYAQEDGGLRKFEEQAYLEGNFLLRDYEDKLKMENKKQQLKESKNRRIILEFGDPARRQPADRVFKGLSGKVQDMTSAKENVDVEAIQSALNNKKVTDYEGRPLDPDGRFGKRTLSALLKVIPGLKKGSYRQIAKFIKNNLQQVFDKVVSYNRAGPAASKAVAAVEKGATSVKKQPKLDWGSDKQSAATDKEDDVLGIEKSSGLADPGRNPFRPKSRRLTKTRRRREKPVYESKKKLNEEVGMNPLYSQYKWHKQAGYTIANALEGWVDNEDLQTVTSVLQKVKTKEDFIIVNKWFKAKSLSKNIAAAIKDVGTRSVNPRNKRSALVALKRAIAAPSTSGGMSKEPVASGGMSKQPADIGTTKADLKPQTAAPDVVAPKKKKRKSNPQILILQEYINQVFEALGKVPKKYRSGIKEDGVWGRQTAGAVAFMRRVIPGAPPEKSVKGFINFLEKHLPRTKYETGG